MNESAFKQMLKAHLPGHTVMIETSTEAGVPDMNHCHEGKETWIEAKIITGKRISLRAAQIPWARRRERAKGLVFIVAYNNNKECIVISKFEFLIDKTIMVGRKLSAKIQGVPGAIIYSKPFDWESIINLLVYNR